MPLKGKSISADISEFSKGQTFKHTAKKFGKRRAQKQAVAVAYAKRRERKK